MGAQQSQKLSQPLHSAEYHELLARLETFPCHSNFQCKTKSNFLFLDLRPSFQADTMTSAFRLDGKVALVTGAGRGIGASIAVELARAGAKVIVNYASSSGPAEKVVAEIKGLGSDAVAIQANVRDVKETVRLFEAAKAQYGQLDIVVSNAGVVSFGHFGEVTEVSDPHE